MPLRAGGARRRGAASEHGSQLACNISQDKNIISQCRHTNIVCSTGFSRIGVLNAQDKQHRNQNINSALIFLSSVRYLRTLFDG
jgi:hypothetical protein